MSNISIHVGIISWEGHHDAAWHIASELAGHVDKITVVYSNASGRTESGEGEWLQVDNSTFAGPKFKTLVDRVSEDVFFLIAADAATDHWADVVHACRAAFVEPNGIGFWSPEVRISPYTPDVVVLSNTGNKQIDCINVDTIVCAMSKNVYQHVRTYPFQNNNFGWGIDYAASAAAMLNGQRIVMDCSIVVSHPPSRGYNDDSAQQQLDQMLMEIPSADRVIIKLIETYIIKQRIAIRIASRPVGVRQALKVLGRRVARPITLMR